MTIPVVHTKKEPVLAGDVYIGRPSPYGNPFAIGPDGSREEVIEKYRRWLEARPELVSQLAAENPKRLRCWCYPASCHGDVLAEALGP